MSRFKERANAEEIVKMKTEVSTLKTKYILLEERMRTLLDRQDILSKNQVLLKQDIDEVKNPKKNQYFK